MGEHAIATEYYVKTEAGRQEIRAPSRNLPRPARNLLLIIDENRAVTHWVDLVHGSSPEDVNKLASVGLISPAAGKAESRAAPPAASLPEALERLSYEQLYGLLTSQARDRLGLIKGFRFVLEVEKCANVAELRTLSERFIALVDKHQGPAAARQMRRAIGAVA